MIKVRKTKMDDPAQRNHAIRYVLEFEEGKEYLTEKAIMELHAKLNKFILDEGLVAIK